MSKDAALSIRIDSYLKNRLEYHAINNNTVLSKMVTKALEETVAKYDFELLFASLPEYLQELWESRAHSSSYVQKLEELNELIRVRIRYGHL